MSFFSAILASLTSFSIAAAAAPQPGELKTYKDWIVGCDNTAICLATSLTPDWDSRGNEAWNGLVTLKRTPEETDNLEIRIAIEDSDIGHYKLMIDNSLLNSGAMTSDDHGIEIVGEEANKITHAIATGHRLTIVARSGTVIARISLAGSAAALRYMDTQQLRSGTPTALVAKGRRPFKTKHWEIPIISTTIWEPSQNIPGPKAIAQLVKHSGCELERFGDQKDTVVSLGQRDDIARAFVLILCGHGAYNFSSAPYIGELDLSEKGDGKWSFASAKFDYLSSWNDKTGQIILVNADWDEQKHTLSSISKGRGLGDCGNAESYIWDGEIFRLIEASAMDECRGAYEWIKTWRASHKLETASAD